MPSLPFFFCLSPLPFIFLLVGIVFATRARSEARRIADLDEQGSVKTGHIISHSIYRRGRGVLCYVTYRYEVGGQVYTRGQEIGRDHYNDVKDGETIAVCYLARTPSTAMLAESHRDETELRRYRHTAIGVFAGVLFMVLAVSCMLLLVSTAHH
jgi:hypothetical protein